MNIKDECENEPTKPAKYVNVNDQGRQRGWTVYAELETQ